MRTLAVCRRVVNGSPCYMMFREYHSISCCLTSYSLVWFAVPMAICCSAGLTNTACLLVWDCICFVCLVVKCVSMYPAAAAADPWARFTQVQAVSYPEGSQAAHVLQTPETRKFWIRCWVWENEDQISQFVALRNISKLTMTVWNFETCSGMLILRDNMQQAQQSVNSFVIPTTVHSTDYCCQRSCCTFIYPGRNLSRSNMTFLAFWNFVCLN